MSRSWNVRTWDQLGTFTIGGEIMSGNPTDIEAAIAANTLPPIAVAEHRFFLRSFHGLLRACTEFYQQANFTTVIPDGFPILNCLREVHLTLAEGAHNQYGDPPWTARAEMLTQQ